MQSTFTVFYIMKLYNGAMNLSTKYANVLKGCVNSRLKMRKFA